MKNPKLVEAVKVMREARGSLGQACSAYWSVYWSAYYSACRSAFCSAYRSASHSACDSAYYSAELDKEKVLKIIKEKYEKSKIS